MNTSGTRLLGFALAILASHSMAGAAHAQAASPIRITNSAYQEVVVKADDGSVSKKLVPAARVVPGDDVVYELSYANHGDASASNVRLDNPVPKELVFVDAPIPPAVVSVDDGKHFAALDELTIPLADGTSRPAQPADITNLRWIVATLAPGASGKVVYRARVR